MLEVVTRPNSLWVADFFFLTRRIPKKKHNYRKYRRNYIPRTLGVSKVDVSENVTFLPKWARWNFDFSQFNKWDKLDKKPLRKIPVYDKPIVLFAVQDVASRYILHACLKQSPKEFVKRSYGYPYWFTLDSCLRESLQNLPHPFIYLHFAMDSVIHRLYAKRILSSKTISTFPINDDSRFLSATLEGFFSRLQYEFREELTQKNLDSYIKFWNNQRTMKALESSTPSHVYYSDYF